jgi:hypothetical protein
LTSKSVHYAAFVTCMVAGFGSAIEQRPRGCLTLREWALCRFR